MHDRQTTAEPGRPDARAPQAGGAIAPLSFRGGDDELVRALRARHPGAAAALWDRHAPTIERAVTRALGPDPEVPDLVQETFMRAIDEIGGLEDPGKLPAWLTGVAVFTTRACIRRRKRRRWLARFAPWLVELGHQAPAPEGVRQALREVYATLDELPPDDRIAFALRFIDGMQVADVASACRVSLATIKRRIKRAEDAFVKSAATRPALREWLEEGSRWGRMEEQG